MTGRRDPFHRFVTVLQLVAGLVIAGLFLVLGLSGGDPDRTWFDRAFPFVVAGVALVVTAVVTRRALRARRAEHPALPRPAARPAPAPEPAPQPGPATEHSRPEPSAAARAEVARILDVLDRAGVLRPRAPDPDDLTASITDGMTAFDVLSAVAETATVRPGFRLADHTARLAFHADQVEQDEEYLREQIADLDRLARDHLAVTVDEVRVVWTDGSRVAPARVRIRLDGAPRNLDHSGAVKYLSTVVHCAVATALREKGAPVRLASLASDAGMWIAALPSSTDLDDLNAELRAPSYERWEWLDEQEPHAAGESPPTAL